VPVVVASKTRYAGTVTPSALNTETVVVDIPAQTDDYIVEGYIDLGALASGDAVTIKEYIALDGVNYRTFVTASYSGPVGDPIVRFHAKTIYYGSPYRVTITQTAGTLRSFPYRFILEVLGAV
jgi:hypothetical protein